MTAARLAPALPPFDPEVAERLDSLMQGRPPLRLFSTLARDPRLFKRFFAGGLLDPGHLSLRQREIVIDRTTALCGAEYEWGVHVALFGRRAALSEEQVRATVAGAPDAACWDASERVLLRLCDALHRDCDIDDGLWAELRGFYSEEAVLELLMLAGFYRTVSYLCKGLRLPLEAGMPRFPAA
ncbi:carboxymuconolactone decarboxylase family protein [Roseateles sp. DAIF2]|uniref:carboxymuconolactone decarboxylase family protein n=1 Tax=Roseateles sp. DAIF2 TaxID=2714952 RepID=UPI0018A278DB|nr:carboxymuconolactone decarboxylase family protein [Roseateles sp. DAIF2]QPF74606.1 carboxymuconolactone decarboxylase family protein [Roseateles sp. DAIF2]